MFKPWRLGSLLGFPLEINPSFLFLLGLVLVAFGGLIGVAVVLVAFASVVLHELGHAVVARRLGVRVVGIELGFFGGAAKMINMPTNARAEISIAAAGPLVSIVLGLVGLALGKLGLPFVGLIGWINLIIAAFNLIPALPMDGGRILRAALSTRYSHVRATDLAVTVARVVAIGFAILGLLGSYQLLFLAPFLWLQGTREKQIARMQWQHDSGVEVLDRNAWDDRRAPRGTGLRGFRIVQRNGRMVIETD
ncbi:MAG: M50 family metallopeptidase [Proteobacteria bacterium]|nr:M50 family metallopeptidase [Pseudomonadota bacterium]